MFRFLFLIFLIVPLVEIYVLLKVGGIIGALPTVVLVVFTAVLGAALIRLQGLVTFWRLQEKLQVGEMPAEEILTGVALLLAGALLLTPGFVTDTVGFLLLVPPVRRRLFSRMVVRMSSGAGFYGGGFQSPGAGAAERPSGRRTLEGEFRRDDD